MLNTSKSTRLVAPMRRPLRVYAFDPSRGRLLGNEMLLDVRYRPLAPGPVDKSGAHDQIAVIDYDVSRNTYYRPVDLDDPYVLIPNGIPPSESDPRFHQQMLYAVASDTIEQFENALGRRIHWRRAERPLNARKGWLPERTTPRLRSSRRRSPPIAPAVSRKRCAGSRRWPRGTTGGSSLRRRGWTGPWPWPASAGARKRAACSCASGTAGSRRRWIARWSGWARDRA